MTNLMVQPQDIEIVKLNLPRRLKYLLRKRLFIVTLQYLLDTDYFDLINAKGIGEKGIHELEECVNRFGFTLKKERQTLQDIKNTKHTEGKKLLEEYGFSLRVCAPLYQNNVFTLEDLIRCGKEVYVLKGVGIKRGEAIWEKMQELHIPFPKYLTADEEISASLKEMNEESAVLRQQLEDKKFLLKKYQYVSQLKKNLLDEQQTLDSQLEEQKKPMYNLLIDGVGGVTYLYDASVSEGLDASNMMGFFLHRNGIKEFIAHIPVYKYYTLDEKHQVLEITNQQADFLYDQILAFVLKKQG